MASTKKYLSHLLQNTGITPACSEEERAAADVIAKVFANHGFEPEVQEFNASGTYKIVQAALGIAAFLGAVLMGIGGAIGIIGLLLAVAAGALYWVERSGRPVLSSLGRGGLSQNVIAYHKASGPLASPRNRPVVVVAHYDSPRVDFLAQQPYAAYRPLMMKLLPACMAAPAVLAIVRMLPFPGAAKTVLWLLAIVAALIPLAHAVAIIANRFVLPYTTGSVCNKSSVAAMLGVMDAVAPFGDAEEFPEDVPADEYFAEQERIVEEAARAAAEAEAAAAAAMYPHEQEAAEAGEAAEEGAELEPAAEGADAADDGSDAEATGLFEAVSAEPADSADEGDAGQEGALADPSSTVTMQVSEEAAGSTQVFPVAAEAVEATQVEGDAVDAASAGPAVEDEAVAGDVDAPYALSSAGAIRFGAEVVRGLNMLPAACVVVYEDDAADVLSDAGAAEAAEAAVAVAPERADEGVVVADPSVATEDADTVLELPVEAVVEDELEDELETSAADEPTSVDDGPSADSEEAVEAPRETIVEDGVVESAAAGEPVQEPVTPEVSAAPAASEVAGAPAPQDSVAEQVEPGATQVFAAVPAVDDAPEHTVAMPAQPVETVDSLMAEISRPAPAPAAPSALHIPDPVSASPAAIPVTANRASLFDLPDPLASNDPFGVPSPAPQGGAASATPAFSVVDPVEVPAASAQPIETISAPAPVEEKPRRGLGRLFGRKKKRDDSMSDWLGVDEGFDAQRSGSDIGSWDNFDDDGWKGGATGLSTMTEDDLRDAITSMGDDELLGHDIWFVATGASECGNAGMKAFLDEHRDKLRGVFLINLESVGAGTLATLATEGRNRVLKGDRRIGGLVSRVSADFHQEFARVEMPHEATDAYAAMEMSLRSLTIGGVDEVGFALSRTGDDQPYNVDVENVARVADVVTEVIRRS